MPERDVRHDGSRRDDGAAAEVAEREPKDGQETRGDEDEPSERRGDVDGQDLVQVRGVQEQHRVGSEQHRVDRHAAEQGHRRQPTGSRWNAPPEPRPSIGGMGCWNHAPRHELVG